MDKAINEKKQDMQKEITTVKLSKETKERVDKLKIYKRESYDEILQRMLDLLTLSRNSPGKAQARLMALEKQRKMQERI